MVIKLMQLISRGSLIRLLTLLCLQLFSLTILAQDSVLTTKVDRAKISIDETFNLTIRYNGKTGAQPDFSLLNEDFTVRNQGTSSQTILVNGSVEATTEWHLLLEPKREGKLLIPSFKVENAYSEAIEVEVTPPHPVPAGTLQDIFLETIIEESSAYVQEQIKVSYRLYFAIGVDSLDADPFNLPDVVIEQLPEAIYQRKVSGRDYRVAEYSYAFFPQSSGQLSIPALNWRVGVQMASNQRDFFGRPLTRTQLKRLRSEGKNIEIKPKPANFPADAVWLPANNLKISETWSSEEFKVGEPVTRNLTTIAEGLRVEQLPIFLKEEHSDDRIKFYADQPQSVDDKNAGGFVAKRVESAAVVINTPGEVRIPAIRIPWWDVDEDKLKYAEIPARTVEASGTANAIQAPPVSQQAEPGEQVETGSNIAISEETLAELNALETRLFITQLLLALSLLMSIIFAALYFRERRNPTQQGPQTSIDKRAGADSTILKACETASPPELRKLLLLWAGKRWPTREMTTLGDIAQVCKSQTLAMELKKLDAALYREDSTEAWNGQTLAAVLKEALAAEKQATKTKNELADLY